MHFQKFTSMILAVALTLSLCVVSVPSAFAAGGSDSSYLSWLQGIVDDLISGETFDKFLQRISADNVFGSNVNQVTPEQLVDICNRYRTNIYNAVSDILAADVVDILRKEWDKVNRGASLCRVAWDDTTKTYRLYNDMYRYFIVDSSGRYPYCTQEDWFTYANISGSEKPFNPASEGKWLDHAYVEKAKTGVNPQSEANLAILAVKVRETYGGNVFLSEIIIGGQSYKCIRQRVTNPGYSYDQVWCDSLGYPYAYSMEPDKMASQNSTVNNYTQVTDKTENNPTYNQTTIINNNTTGQDYTGILLDINNGVLNLIDEVGMLDTQDIYNVTYDSSDHSYHVTTYNQTFNQTNNYYEYNYYTYNIQYTYNNTYITYIGSTAEYQPKEWELYYELPDGRSSADLTEDDVAGLSFQFNDCINYKKSATDTALRALYHFDGNTNDSGFFSDKTAFTWNSGASITYMDANAFDGALYLDEKAHQFTITLPSNIGSGDFTLQWRYYQNSATTTDHNENYINVGGAKLLGWSEQSLYNGSGTKLAGLSVGTWQELAIVRHNGTVYLYHNGVKIGSVSNSSVLTNKIIFFLGANSRAHSMLDEMRFVKGALYTGGKAYTPTSVPYDTNAVLVLPDSPVPVVDSYWSFDKTITPLKSWDFMAKPGSFYRDYSTFSCRSADSYGTEAAYYYTDSYSSPADYLYYSGSSILLTDSALHIGNGLLESDDTSCPSAYNAINPVSASQPGKYPMYTPVSYLNGSFYIRSGYRPYIPISALQNGTYTFTAVFADGSMGSATITLSNYFSLSRTPNVTEKKNGYDYSGYCYRNSYPGPISLSSGSNKLNLFYCSSYAGDGDMYSWEHRSYNWLSFSGNCDLVYLEICQGSKGNTNHQYITAEYDPTELQPNTAAIQTDIPIKGYTVGGVRPTFPERGDVWFPVEGSRIAGVQIYNGQAWEETNARWWTGFRWIPIYAFDLVTLADMWDVTSSGGADVEVTPPITSETGFWNWWKKSWNDFTGKLFSALQGGSVPGGSITNPSASPDPDASPSPSREPSDYDTLLPGETPDPEDPEGGESWHLFDLLGALKDAGWTIVKGTVTLAFDGIGGIVGAVVDVGGFFSSMGDLKHDMKDIGGGDWNWTP